MKHGCPRRQQSRNMAKISKSYILTPPHPQGYVMSVKCEEPIDELTVQVWLLYHHPNFKYCTLFVSGMELRTDRRTDRRTNGRTDVRTDDPITRCPRRTFQAGGIKMKNVGLLSSNLPSIIDRASRLGDKFDRSMSLGKLLDNYPTLFIFIS